MRFGPRERGPTRALRAIAKLAKDVKAELPAALVAELGMPDDPAMRKLVADARAEVWG